MEMFLAVKLAPPHGLILKQQLSGGMSLMEATSNFSGAGACANKRPVRANRKVDVII
jgi:hypothetical protein